MTVIRKVAALPEAMTITPSAAAAAVKAAKAAAFKAKQEQATAAKMGEGDGPAVTVSATAPEHKQLVAKVADALGGAGALTCPRTKTKYTSFGDDDTKREDGDKKMAEADAGAGAGAGKRKQLDGPQEGGKDMKRKKGSGPYIRVWCVCAHACAF